MDVLVMQYLGQSSETSCDMKQVRDELTTPRGSYSKWAIYFTLTGN